MTHKNTRIIPYELLVSLIALICFIIFFRSFFQEFSLGNPVDEGHIIKLSIILGLIFTFGIFWNLYSFSDRSKLVVSLIIFTLVYSFFSYIFGPIISDDAYISFEYSRNLFLSGELYFSKISGSTEGYSNLLWVLIGSLAAIYYYDITPVMVFFGFFSGLACILILYYLLKTRTQNSVLSFISAFYLASIPFFSYWATSGLETGLHSLVLLVSISLSSSKPEMDRSKMVLFWVFLGLLVLSRFEGIILAGIVLLIRIIESRTLLFFEFDKSKIWRNILKERFYIFFFLSFCIFYNLWRLVYFGNIVSPPFLSKKTGLVVPSYLFGFLSQYILFLLPILFYILLRKRNVSINTESLDNLVVTLLLILSAYSFTSDWMNGYRLLIPLLPLILYTSFWILSYLLPHEFILSFNFHRETAISRMKSIIIIILICLTTIHSQQYQFIQYDSDLDIGEQMFSKELMNLALLYRSTYENKSTIALYDVGAFAYYTDFEIIDLGGLNDYQIAWYIRNNEYGSAALYVLNKKPDLIRLNDIHPIERELFLLLQGNPDYIPSEIESGLYVRIENSSSII